MNLDFSGKVALVTGGASGIGAACARAFHAAGAKIVIADLNPDTASRLASELGDRAVATQLDVADSASCQAMVDLAVKQFGGLDIAVNNAGISTELAPIPDTTVDDWRKVISINLDGVFYCLKAEMAAMKAGASIVNIASIMGAIARTGAAAYVASKHGVVGLTKVAALEGADRNIRVNAIGPGYIETPLLQQATLEALDQIAALHPLGRLGKPDEIAAAVLFLVSSSASFITGAYYPVDGGYIAQ
ncbi:MAG: SDR family oxidoreductase [Novosphingobium sp.]|nr:SDR family oxidoreductase [Novosphingobium sp.]